MSATAATLTISAGTRAMDYFRRYGIVVVFVGAVGRADGDVAAIPHRGESAKRLAAELGHRHHRLRHDLRHHLRRVRSVGRGRRGAGQRGRRPADDRVRASPSASSAPWSRGLRWVCSTAS